MNRLLLIASLATGLLLAFVDAQPGWDDTAVMAGAVFVLALVFGWLGPKHAWLWAVTLGLWIPLHGIIRLQNYASLLALLIAFAGAYIGASVGFATRRMTTPSRNP